MTSAPFASAVRRSVVAGWLVLFVGCSTQPPMTTSDPPVKLRLDRLLEFYRKHLEEKKKPPQDEATFKEYIRGLPAERKQGFGMPENSDDLFVGPRDGKPFVVRYKVRIDPGKETEAIAWEAGTTNGLRFVALSSGYVQEYDEGQFGEVRKK